MTRRTRGVGADDARLERLHEQVAPDLLRYFVRRVDEPADAADLLSEAFVVAWRRIRSLPADDHEARLWMFGVARRVHGNWVRGRRRADRLAVPLRLELERAIAASVGTASTDGPDDAIDVRRAVAQLPADQREAVMLVYWDGLPVPDAAHVLGIAITTARGRLHRARRSLRAALGEPSVPSDSSDSSAPSVAVTRVSAPVR